MSPARPDAALGDARAVEDHPPREQRRAAHRAQPQDLPRLERDLVEVRVAPRQEVDHIVVGIAVIGFLFIGVLS